MNQFTAIIRPGDQSLVAACPEFPEGDGQGTTLEECLKDLADSIQSVEYRREDALACRREWANPRANWMKRRHLLHHLERTGAFWPGIQAIPFSLCPASWKSLVFWPETLARDCNYRIPRRNNLTPKRRYSSDPRALPGRWCRRQAPWDPVPLPSVCRRRGRLLATSCDAG